MNATLKKDTYLVSKKELRKTLANLTILYLTARNIHRNMQGPGFIALHKLFEEFYGELSEKIDETAEHIRAIGFAAPADFSSYQKDATIQDVQEPLHQREQGIVAVVEQLQSVLSGLHEAILMTEEDPIRQDFMIGLSAWLEKYTRLIQSNLA